MVMVHKFGGGGWGWGWRRERSVDLHPLARFAFNTFPLTLYPSGLAARVLYYSFDYFASEGKDIPNEPTVLPSLKLL